MVTRGVRLETDPRTENGITLLLTNYSSGSLRVGRQSFRKSLLTVLDTPFPLGVCDGPTLTILE